MAKLVRDRIPEIAPSHSYRIARREEVVNLVLDKVVEEARELREKPSLDELADVYEALRTAARVLGYSWDEVIDRARAKRSERGGFEKFWVMEV